MSVSTSRGTGADKGTSTAGVRRLAAGTAIFERDGAPVLRTAAGEFLDLHAQVGPDLDALPDRVVRAFEERGLFAAPSTAADWTVAVLGEGRIATALRSLLVPAGFGRVVTATNDLPDGPAVVSWCCDALPPPGWRTFDPGTAAWQRCSVEGTTAVLEPVTQTKGDPGPADVRARRLAASGSPEHLAAYWTGPITHSASAVGPVEALFVAALLAADLLALTRGEARTRTLRLADLRTQRVTDHPILPLPAFHPRAERR
ncbi:hypothetical protein [Actinomadura hibisca]|uniref:hypothetical protein n=1 Tax=Actinomadura hibisca TaxID=68565 RepID=UPI00082BD295|nr:hypothetical protein [Actinomadura hibisca]